jgi:hypothetical protein
MVTRTRDEAQSQAEARAAAMRKRPDVRVYHRSSQEPYQPAIQVNPCVDIVELLGRRKESEANTDECPE